jgi:phage terminase small subunit
MTIAAPEVGSDDLNLSGDDELANRVLDNLDQMRPQYLASLLHDGGLAEVVRDRVDRYKRLMASLQAGSPNTPSEYLDEMASSCLGSVNPDWEEEEPLTDEEDGLLRAFREKHQI